ncbi:MAG: DUF362 domain-containing protein, partial [Candidatus Thorarchaeota archaeon]
MNHEEDPKQTCSSNNKHGKIKKGFLALGLVAAVSAIWLALRTGTKPSRVAYPCQQAALSNLEVFKIAILAFIPSVGALRSYLGQLKPAAVLTILVVGSAFLTSNSMILDPNFTLAVDDEYTRVPIDISSSVALASEDTSDLFFVQNATGLEGNTDLAVATFLDMMASEGLQFYKTDSEPSGLIGSDDIVLLKVNGQWDYRGGTNTDLVKSVINAIINHTDGFTGEIVIADNGQGLGNLDRARANAYNHSQAMTDVAASFESYNISTRLWDGLRSSRVDDYDEGDLTDGYVLSDIWNPDTEIFTSYPKFRTEHGTYISFKNGIWDSITGFDSDRLKIINMPVMKSHLRYGVTGSVKNYMGVPKGHIVSSVDFGIPHEHFSIALGGMGTLMAETRAPILNILDMIWINAHPMESSASRGPWSTYSAARFTDIIGISQDPVALDYWASKNILCQTSEYLNYTLYSSLDPDYEPLSDPLFGNEPMDESFHNYLNRSRIVLDNAGFQVTMNETEMNVFVQILDGLPIVPTTPTTPTPPVNDAPL